MTGGSDRPDGRVWEAPPPSLRGHPGGETARHALNVELIGPAGAGKTSVLREIGRRDATVEPWQRFEKWLRHAPAITRDALALAPTALELLRRHPRASRLCLQHLLRLRRFQAILVSPTMPPTRARLLGEGPVYSLCRLHLACTAMPVPDPLTEIWRATLAEWPGALDVVISLDAPDDVLAQRIRLRSKSHEVKHGTDREVYAFLQRYRDSYREVLARLSALGPVHVMAIDTAKTSIDEAAGSVLGIVEQLRATVRPGGNPASCQTE
jgi:shikimate kinase